MTTDLTSAKVLADSINPDGQRLTTLLVTFPRFILAESNTHRAFSRNSASSRAIPIDKQIELVKRSPFVPAQFPLNQKGMSASEYVRPGDEEYAGMAEIWLKARDQAVAHAQVLKVYGVHKQIVTRLLEPFMWHTVIVSSTEWDNFFNLRDSEFAQPEIQNAAVAMRWAMTEHARDKGIAKLDWGDWHLPLITEDDDDDADTSIKPDQWAKISAARCGRVSYLTHAGVRDVTEDLAMFDRLVGPRHLSPLEHPARACQLGPKWHDHGNFVGWHQLRKDYE